MTTKSTTMTRAELARRCSVNAETLRYYERKGLLPKPERSASNYRLYGRNDVTRIHFIQRAKESGFSLSEIRQLLALSSEAGDTCCDVRELVATKAVEVDQKLKSLQAMRRTLDRLMQQCSGDGPLDDCPILKAFESEESV